MRNFSYYDQDVLPAVKLFTSIVYTSTFRHVNTSSVFKIIFQFAINTNYLFQLRKKWLLNFIINENIYFRFKNISLFQDLSP